jgi:large subunit ribosomal protein L19
MQLRRMKIHTNILSCVIIFPRPRGHWIAIIYEKGKDITMNDELLKSVEAAVNPNIPRLEPGDSVSVHVKIKEGNRERIQEFKGTVLFSHNNGNNSTFTVRRVASNGVGVERTFLIRSPRIDKVVVERHNVVRRARLYYLRTRTGKSARLKQKFS